MHKGGYRLVNEFDWHGGPGGLQTLTIAYCGIPVISDLRLEIDVSIEGMPAT